MMNRPIRKTIIAALTLAGLTAFLLCYVYLHDRQSQREPHRSGQEEGIIQPELGKDMQADMQKMFDTDPHYKKFNMTVDSVQIVKTGVTFYRGTAAIRYKGALHTVRVRVIPDKTILMWEIHPDSLAFLNE